MLTRRTVNERELLKPSHSSTICLDSRAPFSSIQQKDVKDCLSASTSKDSHRHPLPHLIKLIQSGACVRSGPHYLRLSGPGRPPTPPILSPCCANFSDRGSRWPHTPPPVRLPPRGSRGEQLVGASWGLASLPLPLLAVCPLIPSIRWHSASSFDKYWCAFCTRRLLVYTEKSLWGGRNLSEDIPKWTSGPQWGQKGQKRENVSSWPPPPDTHSISWSRHCAGIVLTLGVSGASLQCRCRRWAWGGRGARPVFMLEADGRVPVVLTPQTWLLRKSVTL